MKITSPEVGYKFNVGNAVCEVMNCGTGTSEEKSNLNLSSIVIRMTYGEQSFYLWEMQKKKMKKQEVGHRQMY